MNRSPWFNRFRSIITSALALMLLGAVFYLGMYAERTGFVRQVLDPGFKKITLPVLNAFKADPPVTLNLGLNIEQADLDSLKGIRGRALEIGVLIEGKDRWFPVSITANDSVITGKLRLKGGLTDHLQTRKWSYRIKLDSGFTVYGCSRFSIQHPNTRNFTYEWLFHQALRQEGLPRIPYEFVSVAVNGTDLGIHAFEGHFDANWSVDRFRVEGPVMKFDDEYRLIALSEVPEAAQNDSLHPLASWYSAPIDAFQLKKVLGNAKQRSIYEQNVKALEQFRKGEKTTHEVFDVQAFARFFAICDVMGAQHAQDWRNIRFVQEKEGERLLPIGFDANAGEAIIAIRAMREQGPISFGTREEGNFYEMIFSDSLFFTTYISELERISDDQWLEQLLERNKIELVRNLKVIGSEFPRFEHDNSIFEQCAGVIRRNIHPSIAARITFDPAQGMLKVSPLHGLPVYLERLFSPRDTISVQQVFPAGRANGRLVSTTMEIGANAVESNEFKAELRVLGVSENDTIQIQSLITP